MKKISLLIVVFALFTGSAMAQKITPIWEYLNTSTNPPLPILKAQPNEPDDVYDGTNLFDTYGGFQRYDDKRLLLGIRENGINENDPKLDPALAAIAKQYPDRSLIWIDPANGKPLGIALVIGIHPVQLDQDFLDAGGTKEDVYFTFAVSDDGNIFTGFKNKILRYAPDGKGGFSAPTVAYTFPSDGMDPTYWPAWRSEAIKVKGAGKNTVLLTGGKTWRPSLGYYVLTTTDGVNFKAQADVALEIRGGASEIILSPNGNDEWVFGTVYPGSFNGFGISANLYSRAAGPTDNFQVDPDYKFTAPDVDLEKKNYLDSYIGWFFSAFAASDALNFLAVYSTPSYDTKDPETAGALGFGDSPGDTPYLPGWLALHDKETGAYIDGSAHKLDVYESSETDSTSDATHYAAPWHGALGNIQLYVPAGAPKGAAELLWYSGIYGYGRYAIGDLPVAVDEWSLF